MSTTDHTGSGAVSGEKPWHRAGTTLYTLKEGRDIHGRFGLVNDHTMHVQGPDAEAVAERIHAALASQPAPVRASVEGDYVLVPREPAPGMERAFDVAYWSKANDIASPTPTEHPDDGGGAFGYGYRAMLAAAPRSDRPLTGTPDAGGDLGELARLSEAAPQGPWAAGDDHNEINGWVDPELDARAIRHAAFEARTTAAEAQVATERARADGLDKALRTLDAILDFDPETAHVFAFQVGIEDPETLRDACMAARFALAGSDDHHPHGGDDADRT